MSENSLSRFADRLVRRSPVSGRSSDAEFSGSRSVSASKRSVKDRLGTTADDSFEGRSHEKDKRQKGEPIQESRHSNDTHLAKADLRFELSQLRQKKEPPIDVDLRVKLSSMATFGSADGNRSCLPENPRQNMENKAYNDNLVHFSMRKSILETKDIYDYKRKNMENSMPELRGSVRGKNIREFGDRVRGQNLREVGDNAGRQRRGELRDVVGRQSIGEHKDTYNVERQIMQDCRDSYSGVKRKNIQEPWETYNGENPKMLDTRDGYDHGRQRVLGPTSRMGCDLPADADGYSSWALDYPRRRSPDKTLSSSIIRTSSPERNLEPQRRAFIRPYVDEKSNVYRRNEVPSLYTPVGPVIRMRRPPLNALPPISAAPAPLPAHFPQSIPRNQNPVCGGQPSIDGFLQRLGLEKYSINFQQEEVDFHALRQMSDNDLKELKIPMGPRKKILQALLPPPRR